MGRDLPFCPADQPTFFPTALPSFTPFPTATPLPTVTPFPSVTPFPTTDAEGGPTAPVTPPATATLAPSNPGDTIAPTRAVVDGQVLVESILEYGFFPEVTLREPTEEEYNGLMAVTTDFYTQALRAAFPNLQSFEAVRVADEFRPTNTDRPVQVDFDAFTTFTPGTTVPTSAEVFEVMEDLDYMSKSISSRVSVCLHLQ